MVFYIKVSNRFPKNNCGWFVKRGLQELNSSRLMVNMVNKEEDGRSNETAESYGGDTQTAIGQGLLVLVYTAGFQWHFVTIYNTLGRRVVNICTDNDSI